MRRSDALIYVLLSVAVLAVYGWSVGHKFLYWDDDSHIAGNPYLQPVSLANLIYFWRQPYFTHYVPVSYTMFWAEAWLARTAPDQFGNLQFNPAVFHAVSVGLHLVCVVLAYRLLLRLVGSRQAAGIGAGLFALHPLQVESVAWVSEQRGLLAGVFTLLAMLAWLRFGRGVQPQPLAPGNTTATGGMGWYALASAAYLLALLAKPSAVSVPLLAAVLDLFWLRRRWPVSVAALLPWVALAGGMVAIMTVQQPGSKLPFETPWLFRPLIAADALTFYLMKIVWPLDLIIHYPRAPQTVLEHKGVYFAWILPAIVLALCYRFRTTGPWLVCAGWFVASLAPVLGLASFAFQHYSTVADRYVYLAMLAPALALGWWHSRLRSRSATLAALALLSLLAALSFQQVGYWRDNESLFGRTLRLNPASDAAHANWALLQITRGEYADALEHVEEGIRLNPRGAPLGSYLNRGRALQGLGRFDEAVAAYQEAIARYPYSDAALMNLSTVYFQQQDWTNAVHAAQAALAIEPENIIARFNLALSLERAGRQEEALEQFGQILLRRPDHHPARLKLGMLLAFQGKQAQAMEQFRYILARQDDPSAHAELARGLLKVGDATAAVQHLEQALQQHSPVWADIAGRLAWLRATHPSPQVRDGQQAMVLAQEACNLTGNQSPALIQTLAAAQAETGDFEQAVASAQRAGDLRNRRATPEGSRKFRNNRNYSAEGSRTEVPQRMLGTNTTL